MNRFISIYTPSFPSVIAYMLQSTEYDAKAYLAWLHRTKDFSAVMHRRTLDRTAVAKAFLLFMAAGILLQLVVAALMMIIGYTSNSAVSTFSGVLLLLSAPIVWAYLVIIPLLMAKQFVINPKLERQRRETQRILSAHKGVKIAVAGSYGKTTMKELLATVLSEGMRVAATPGNKNVATAHYQFAHELTGNEEALIIEFGEGKPGDVKRFTETVQPDIAVITGLAPAHLDQYGSLEAAGNDIFSLAEALDPHDVYVNLATDSINKYVRPGYIGFDVNGIDGWKAEKPTIDLNGTRFALTKSKHDLQINSQLIGEHLIGVLSATAVIANKLGMSKAQIEAGFAHTKPYEHRMQPYRLGGAWIIDDAYNGNIQGVEAGTHLLASLKATRKIYVTPGLVDQGSDTATIHKKMGKLIAHAKPTIVVLMKNSVTDAITQGLKEANYTGEIVIQNDPLAFYTNLDQFVAAGDIVLLQNDWTDNYQ
jgi:UDP-N-acetylmuramoyl-tripeptide--D-alanyl-D-alanine ligase